MATPAVRARRRRNRANRRAKVAAGMLPPRVRGNPRRRGPANVSAPLGFTTQPRTTFSNTGQRSVPQLPRRARRRIGGATLPRQPAGGLPAYALAVVDPANPDVIGTKIPDGDMTPSYALLNGRLWRLRPHKRAPITICGCVRPTQPCSSSSLLALGQPPGHSQV